MVIAAENIRCKRFDMADQGVFIDKIFVHGPNKRLWPGVNDGFTVTRKSNGDEYERARYQVVQGAFGTSYLVTVSDAEWRVQLNPSKFEREENVFGFGYVDSKSRVMQVLNREGCEGQWLPKAYCTMLHLTGNVSFGCPAKAREYLEALAGAHVSRCAKSREAHGGMVFKNNSKRIIVYDKAKELREVESVDEKVQAHREKCAQWLSDRGVLRIEVQLHREYLRRHKLRDLDGVTEQKLLSVYEKEVSPMGEIKKSCLDDLSFAELGVLDRWKRGLFRREMLDRKTAAKYRKNIRKVTGFDIYADQPIAFKAPERALVPRRLKKEDYPDFMVPDIGDFA